MGLPHNDAKWQTDLISVYCEWLPAWCYQGGESHSSGCCCCIYWSHLQPLKWYQVRIHTFTKRQPWVMLRGGEVRNFCAPALVFSVFPTIFVFRVWQPSLLTNNFTTILFNCWSWYVWYFKMLVLWLNLGTEAFWIFQPAIGMFSYRLCCAFEYLAYISMLRHLTLIWSH